MASRDRQKTPAGMMRAAALTSYADVAASVGLDPRRLLKGVGLHSFRLDDPDLLIPAEPVFQLLERSASASGVEDFGLRMAARRQLANIGPISLLLREEPTLRHALKALERHFLLYSDLLALRLDEQDGMATLRAQFALATGGGARQANELLIGTAFRVMRALAGEAFAPEIIAFSHTAPAGRTIHYSFFRTRATFDSAFTGIVLREADLDAPIVTADATMARYVKQYLEGIIARPTITLDASIRQLVMALLPSGRCTSDVVARHLGIDRRTVTRRLGSSGQTFSAITNEVRIELAHRHIAAERRSLTETASLLGFAELSTFSRWFRVTFGCSPTDWRTRQLHAARKSPRKRVHAAARRSSPGGRARSSR